MICLRQIPFPHDCEDYSQRCFFWQHEYWLALIKVRQLLQLLGVSTLTPARLSEKNLTFKLQNRGLCRARTSDKLKVNLTSLQTNTNVDFTFCCCSSKRKKKKSNNLVLKEPKRYTFSRHFILLFKRTLIEYMGRVTFGFLNFQNK